jgi:hypothetical protein
LSKASPSASSIVVPKPAVAADRLDGDELGVAAGDEQERR